MLRPPGPGDAALLVAGRDDAFFQFLGPGAVEPAPTAVIVAGGHVVGFVDYDGDRDWLAPSEVNLGYHVFAERRGESLASRAVQLLMHHLAVGGEHETATLLISPENAPSLALARRLGFAERGRLGSERFFARPVPPVAYADGVVTLRPLATGDLDPGERPTGEFATGPRFAFALETGDGRVAAVVVCDLAGPGVERGVADVAYLPRAAASLADEHRAVRLALRFLAEHTGAREARSVVDGVRVRHGLERARASRPDVRPTGPAGPDRAGGG